MNGEKILRAITDIDDDFIIKAADDEYLKNVFRQLRKKQPVRVNMRKMIIAAIIIVLIIIISVFTVSSVIFNINSNLFEMDGSTLNINIDEIDRTADGYSLTGTPLADSLKANGFDCVTIPSVVLTEEYRLKNIKYEFFNAFIYSHIEFEKITDGEKKFFYIHIRQYSSETFLLGGHIEKPKHGTVLRVNGLDVFCFDMKREPYLKYYDNLTAYSMGGDVSYDELLEIAKTIC